MQRNGTDAAGGHLTRRRLVALVAPALAGPAIGGVLAACSAGRPAQPAGGELSQAPATVTFLGRGSAVNQQTFEELSRSFSERFPQITVQYTHESGNFDQKYTVLGASDQLPDVGFGTVAFYKGHVARGLATYLDELVKRDKAFHEQDYDPYWLVALKYKGRLAGLPWDPGMVVLAYNRNLFQKAGIPFPDPKTPMTWEDTIDIARRLVVDNGSQVDQWGLEVWWSRFWWQIPRQLGLLDVYQGDENVLKLDDPLALEGLQWLADLRMKYKVARPPNYSGPAAAFTNGNVGMSADGAWTWGTNRTKLQDDWDVAPLPQFKGKKRITMGQASPFILATSSKVKDQAWQLMKYLSGPDGQQLALERGISQPMLRSQFQSPAFTKLTPPHSHEVAVNETQYAVPPPYGPSYNDVQALIDQVMGPVYNGEQSARQAIQAAMPQFRQILDETKARYG